MAMAFAMAKLRLPGLIIKNPEVVNKNHFLFLGKNLKNINMNNLNINAL